MRSLRRALGRAPREAGRAVSWQMIAIAIVALVLSLALFAIDERLSRTMVLAPHSWRWFLDYLTDVGLIKWYFYPALFGSLYLLVVAFEPGDASERRRRAIAFVHLSYLTASLGLATTITHILKWIFGRSRPALIDENGALDFVLLRVGNLYESFPSGHSNNMGVVAMALAIWFPALRWPLLAAGAALAATRVLVEAHFPSDVVAGFSIGALTALASARFLARRGIVYRFTARGLGWAGFFPHRPVGAEVSFSSRNRPGLRTP